MHLSGVVHVRPRPPARAPAHQRRQRAHGVGPERRSGACSTGCFCCTESASASIGAGVLPSQLRRATSRGAQWYRSLMTGPLASVAHGLLPQPTPTVIGQASCQMLGEWRGRGLTRQTAPSRGSAELRGGPSPDPV